MSKITDYIVNCNVSTFVTMKSVLATVIMIVLNGGVLAAALINWY